jgi:uncharacterized protein
MMVMESRLIQEVFKASNGRIVGRIRLQKIFYLLEQLGLNSGLRFSYHHYGPYSEELAHKLFIAEILDKVIAENEEVSNAGATYSIFNLKIEPNDPLEQVGAIPFKKALSAITAMKEPTSVVIELAATIHWLKHKEVYEDWKAELKIRKPTKATDNNIDLATKLLGDIELN